jgi:hypothetical protein
VQADSASSYNSTFSTGAVPVTSRKESEASTGSNGGGIGLRAQSDVRLIDDLPIPADIPEGPGVAGAAVVTNSVHNLGICDLTNGEGGDLRRKTVW